MDIVFACIGVAMVRCHFAAHRHRSFAWAHLTSWGVVFVHVAAAIVQHSFIWAFWTLMMTVLAVQYSLNPEKEP